MAKSLRSAVGALGLCALITACGGENEPDDGSAKTQALTSSPTSSESGSPSPTPNAAQGIKVAVPSHCGVLSVTVKGDLWLADPPLGGHNPPRGWDENVTLGHFVRINPRLGKFVGDGGQEAKFRRAGPGTADPNSGCE